MTKILLTTFGTRGDIQPFIALARGLQGAGYEVALASSQGYQADVESHHVPFIAMDNDSLELTEALLDTSQGVGKIFASIRKMGPAVRKMMDDEWHAAQAFQPDLLIYHPKCLGSYHVAEKLGIPAILSIPLPFYTPTSEFAVPFFARDFGARFNRFSYRLFGFANAMYSGSINDLRQNVLGLPPIGRFTNLIVQADGQPVPVIYPISQHVLPVPADYPDHVHITGYWFLDQDPDWQPDPELLRFLQADSPPVYIGFGSVSARNAKNRQQEVLEAVRMSGQRAVLASGWSKLDAIDLPDHIFALKSVPHDWLFPQVSAVVHHGGAGTTAAGLRAGKPTVICPFLGDQPFWGKRVYDLGVGVQPILQRNITGERLGNAIRTVTDDAEMQKRATALGEKIRAEDGIACAIDVIDKIISR